MSPALPLFWPLLSRRPHSIVTTHCRFLTLRLFICRVGSSKGYDFEISAEDMVDVLNELEEYVLTESVTQLKKVLD